MLRESSQADLARTIAVLPNLIYVDLPEGLFADDPSYVTLRLEVQARCPDLRKMTYMAGSERSLELLARGTIWTRLEVLELIKINMDPAVLRVVLGAMQNLHALKVKQSEAFNDDVFNPSDMLPPFPPLNEFVLDTVPRITAAGLRTFLSRKETRDALRVLTLTATGVDPSSVHDVVARASNLAHLSIRDEVANPFPATANPPIPPFASRSLQTLHYEISSSPQATPYSNAAGTYYGYLASSILAGGLPNLRAVYVLDVSFPDALLGAPPLPPLQPGGGGSGIQRPGSSSNANGMFGYSGSGARPTSSSLLSPQYHAAFASRLSSNNPFAPPGQRPLTTGSPIGAHTLEVFTRGEDDVDWSFVKMPPPLSASSASNGFHLAPPPSFGHQRSQSGQQYDRSSRLGGGGDWPAPGILAVSGASRRPVSSYGLGADVDGLGWGQSLGSRKSVMVGSAAGGFLAVPSTDDYGRLSSGVAAVPTVPGQYHSGSGSLQPRGGGGDGGSEWPRPRSSAGHHSRSDWMG